MPRPIVSQFVRRVGLGALPDVDGEEACRMINVRYQRVFAMLFVYVGSCFGQFSDVLRQDRSCHPHSDDEQTSTVNYVPKNQLMFITILQFGHRQSHIIRPASVLGYHLILIVIHRKSHTPLIVFILETLRLAVLYS
jgi:hypothetical protein